MYEQFDIQYQSADGWKKLTKSESVQEAMELCKEFSDILNANVRAVEYSDVGMNVVYEKFYIEPQPPFEQLEFNFT